MSPRILAIYEGDFYTRHELGFVASLATKYEVTVINLENSLNKLQISKLTVKSDDITDVTLIKVPITYLNNQNIINKIKVLIKPYDAIVTSARKALLLSMRLRDSVPLILRLWSIRANKIIDNLKHGSYRDLMIFIPSLLANTYYINKADLTITEEYATYTLAKKISKITTHKPVIMIYPPYGTIIDKTSNHAKQKINNDLLNELIALLEKYRNEYALGVTILRKGGEYLKFEALPHALIYYLIAKRNPNIPIFILGSSRTDFIQKTGIPKNKIPTNMIFLNDYQDKIPDWLIERVYRDAKLVINYISNRSISNRLIEALYFGKPIIVNRMAQVLHPDLVHGIHVHIVNREDEYFNAIRSIYSNDQYLYELSKNAKTTYRHRFSSQVNIRLFNYALCQVMK